MRIWSKKIFNITKDNKLQNSTKLKLPSMFIVALLIIIVQLAMQINYVNAASGVRIYNYTSKKEYTYSDLQVKVIYNGKKISVDSTPGLIQNNIALVSYKDIFAKSNIKAECVYDKAAGTVSISKFGTTIVMKIGSKTAYINGKAVTAPLAPVKIKYVNEAITKILVPSRFVFENLGYDYSWNKSTSTITIKDKQFPLLLSYNNGDEFYYKGIQGNVTIDGKKIDLGEMPSIITNNTAMLDAKRVFADTKINADYNYDANNKSIILSQNGNLLEMKIGSPVASLNNIAVVLDTAPMIVTNHNTGESYVMVPGSFTASCLGFDYRWDKNTNSSILNSRQDSLKGDVKPSTPTNPSNSQKPNPPSDKQDSAPELGDSSVTWDKGTILQQWEASHEIIGTSTDIHNIDTGLSNDSLAMIYSVERSYDNLKLNAETYAITGSTPFSTVTSEVIGNQILVHIDNTNCTANTYYFNSLGLGMLDTIRVFNGDNISSNVEFNVLSDKFSYDLSLSSDNKTLYVTIYYNALNKILVGTNSSMDYITLTATKPITATVNNTSGLLTIELPDTKKGINDQYIYIPNGKNINYFNIYHYSEKTYIYIGLNRDCDYYIVEDGNNYTIMLPSSDSFTPVVPEIPNTSVDLTSPQVPVAPEYPIEGPNNYELIIPNPAGFSINQLSHEDQYSKLRFSIRIPGDYVSYFEVNPLIVNSNIITDYSIFLNSNLETEIIVTTSKLQGYELFTDQNYIYINIGNPRDIYKNIIVLDPGHGGTAPGAIYSNTNEKYFNFNILYQIGKDLFDSDPSKLKVYYTRETDMDVSLAERAAFAKKIGADLFVSLHMNANTNKSVYGTEVYYSNSNNKLNSSGLNSEALAKIFVNNISSSLNTKNRGTRAARYTVVHNNTVPAVLLELAFMSNKDDFAKISDSAFQYKAAQSIYDTVLEVFEMYPTGR